MAVEICTPALTESIYMLSVVDTSHDVERLHDIA